MKRKLMLLSIVVAVFGGGVATHTAQAVPRKNTVAVKCPGVVKGVNFYRSATWSWQDKLEQTRMRSNFNPYKVQSCKYAEWVAKYWAKRAVKLRKLYADIQEAKRKELAEINSSPQKAICHVFGSYCSQALAVAKCESGFSVNATNGQYLGLFQMGDYARSTYGHARDALGQARAAYAYFIAAGSDWSPWQCRPYGLGW